MKKLLLTTTGLIATIGWTTAQTFTCPTSQYPSTTQTISSTAPTTITTCNFAGEYSVNNFTATGVYTISSTGGSGNYLTFTDNSNNIILQGNSPLTVTVSSTGLYRIHINTDNACGTETTCRTVIVGLVNTFTCPTTQNPSTTTTISSTAPTTITTCNYAGEYSVNNFTATGVYTISSTGGSGNYLTFTDNSNNIILQGNSPLTVTVSSTGLYRIHINTDNACGTENICRTTVVTPAPAGPCIQTFQYPSSTVTVNSSATTTISTCNFAGDYAVLNFTTAGVYGISSNGGSGNYLTFTDNSNSPIAFGNSPLTVTVSTPGLYRVHFSLNTSCGTENTCRTTMVIPTFTCSTTQYPLTTTTVSSTAPTTITTCNYAGEYSVNNFTATGTYTISATGGSANYITLTDNSNNILAQGNSPLTVTITATGLYRIHINTNNTCGTENTCRTTVVVPTLPPANDNCANAIAITAPGTYTGTTIGATSEPTTVPTCSVTGLTQPGVWFSITGDGSTFIADLCNTSWDSKIFVYAGACGSLVPVGCNDDNGPACSGISASIAWCSVPSTTYYILVTGFSTANNFTLSINSYSASPSISISSQTLCAGNSSTLTITSSYTTSNSVWNYTVAPSVASGTFLTSTGVTLTPTVSTTYSFVVQDNNSFGCAPLTGTITVSVNPIPSASVSVMDATQPSCNNGSATVTTTGGTSPYTYIWSGSASTTSVVTGLNGSGGSGTSHTVTITDANGCSVTQTFTISCVTGIESIVNAGVVNIYPNPTKDVLNIVTNNTDIKHIRIMDVSGRVLLESTTNDSDIHLNINFSNGLYVLEIRTDKGMARFNVVKE
ncbi:MAG: hypothetical protein Fur0023_08180 [Bacteroidia bacterium]